MVSPSLFHTYVCWTRKLIGVSHQLPGWSIKSYKDDEAIPLFVNKVFSDHTQLQYAYYDLPFVCPPLGRRRAGSNLVSGHSISLNLGEVLRGDRIRNSDYELNMGRDIECRVLCRREVDRAALRRARQLVANGYVAEWIVDNLPGATAFVTVDKKRKYYAAGFKIGAKEYSPATGRPRYVINNHVNLVLRWRKAPGRDGELGRKVIVGFEVYPKSIGAADRNAEGCPNHLHDNDEGFELRLPLNRTTRANKYPHSSYTPRLTEEEEEAEEEAAQDAARLSIPYTYSVYFREDDKVEWSNRWDLYFVNQEASAKIRWLAILNSFIICGVLTMVIAVIFARTVRSDLRRHTRDGLEHGKGVLGRRGRRLHSPRLGEKVDAVGSLLDPPGDGDDIDAAATSRGLSPSPSSSDEDDLLEDATGWKMLHGDVFRPPPHGGLLAPLVGSGVQLLVMAGALLVLSCVGILNPSFRGGFVSVGFGLFVAAGVVSGYFSGRVYRTFDGLRWRQNALLTAVLFPGLFFALLFILNLFVWAQASSTALPFGTLVALALLWLCIQLPLVYAGSWLGYVRVGRWEHPTKTHVVPRPVPPPARAGGAGAAAAWWYSRTLPSVLLGGLLPFAVIFIELLFVFKSVWQDKSGYYYVFGFLSAVSLMMVLTVVEVTVVATYLQLCAEVSPISLFSPQSFQRPSFFRSFCFFSFLQLAIRKTVQADRNTVASNVLQNHHWWWQSFFVGSGSALWVFAYSVLYYFTKLHIQGVVSSMLFFGYSLLACTVYGLLTGTIGFLAAYAFVRRMYGYDHAILPLPPSPFPSSTPILALSSSATILPHYVLPMLMRVVGLKYSAIKVD